MAPSHVVTSDALGSWSSDGQRPVVPGSVARILGGNSHRCQGDGAGRHQCSNLGSAMGKVQGVGSIGQHGSRPLSYNRDSQEPPPNAPLTLLALCHC